MEQFTPEATDEQIRAERARARKLRQSPWWKRKRSSGKCHFCGLRFKPAELTMEHVIPLVRGGRSTKNNLVPACKQCNTNKKNLLPMEWEEYINGFST